MIDKDAFWQTKLDARLHDPAEKALVLFRDPEGHEGGTVRHLRSVLFKDDIAPDVTQFVKWADWWASAADRPQLPSKAHWTQVRWTKNPVIIHPLTGQNFPLLSLIDSEIRDIKARSFARFERLIVRSADKDIDWFRTALAYWRFGPELPDDEPDDDDKLGSLWPYLPADTRIPDHTIWDHLDLTSAFAGAFASDPKNEIALLALSIGPVQPFIAASRSVSDMWAGSHLLARLSWEAMRVVCERLGPDSILFPRLRGIPMVDVWLRDECGLPPEWFEKCDWTATETDSNPLFSSALPNRFVAVVPLNGAEEIAQAITRHTREWLQSRGEKVVDLLLEVACRQNSNADPNRKVHAHQQMKEQLAGFPEVHWSVAPFSLICPRNKEKQRDLDTARLSEAMAPFFGVGPETESGFLASAAWKVLRQDIRWQDGLTFFDPNPGVLYPAIYELAERALAAAKSVRPFEQTEQRGWRCSLTGETEWLTTDPEQLETSYRQNDKTLWAKIAKHRPAWAKKGEHLGALAAIKRLWPTIYAKEVGEIVGGENSVGGEESSVKRFVVSTHTMALAKDIELLDKKLSDPKKAAPLEELAKGVRAPALPRSLAKLRSTLAARIPAVLDRLRESEDGSEELRKVEKRISDLLRRKPEAYYSLLLMDGDRLGSILSGTSGNGVHYEQCFHPDIRENFRNAASGNLRINEYLDQPRAASPNRHMTISGALNEFALQVVPEVIESEHLGKVIYAGGDDVLAMLPVADMLSAMTRLRYAYAGDDPEDNKTNWKEAKAQRSSLFCKDGFAYLNGRLMRMMGGATASCGAVIAHHQAPLGAVLRELRQAEQRAKHEGGRNAFCISVVKRSGGALHLTEKWGKPLSLLQDLRQFLAKPSVSRRAAYNCLQWIKDLPRDADREMLGSLLDYQFRRQASTDEDEIFCRDMNLAPRLVELVGERDHREYIENFLGVAEFLAREVRSFDAEDTETLSEHVA